MKKLLKTIVFAFWGFFSSCAQNPPAFLPEVKDPAFQKKLTSLLDFSMPVMGVKDLKKALDQKEPYLILDAREWEEYTVSHLPGARFAGYKDFDSRQWSDVSKDQLIVVYCSVGYRSEKISKKLEKLGYTRVYNLYGSIFEWVNQGFQVVDEKGKPVQAVHTYNEDWSKWVNNAAIKKIW
ncbi:MAG: rhodanese-like domain-containing protein [Saprospiraceae bacterium]